VHGGQVPSTGGSVVVGQWILHLLHFSPIGSTTPQGQSVGTGGQVGVGHGLHTGHPVRLSAFEEPQGHGGQVPCTGGSVVVGQLYLHLLHFSPIGSTTPHGQFVGTGGHVGVGHGLHTGHPVRLVAFEEPHGHGGQVPWTGGSVVVGQLYLHLLHLSPAGKTMPQGQFVGSGGQVGVGHGLHTGHPVRLIAEVDPHGHGGQVPCTGGSVVVKQLILHLLHFSPAGNTIPHGQLVGSGGQVGVGQGLHTGQPVRRVADADPQGHGGQVPCTGGSVVVGQLYLHLLHFSPAGKTTPQGQLVGTGGHVGVGHG
jgi:hypothetical protein